MSDPGATPTYTARSMWIVCALFAVAAIALIVSGLGWIAIGAVVIAIAFGIVATAAKSADRSS